MYEIEGLIKNEYKYIYHSEDIKVIDKIAFKMTLYGIPTRILEDDKVLIFLNGTAYQYKYFKDAYVRKEKMQRILKKDISYTKSVLNIKNNIGRKCENGNSENR